MKFKKTPRNIVLALCLFSLLTVVVLVTVLNSLGIGIANGKFANLVTDSRNNARINKEILSECDVTNNITYYYYPKLENNNAPNNKFGLYIYAEDKDFIKLADNLVNSNDGDWGYVLIPFNVKDNDYSKWENVFSTLYEKHLIPIIQLHDVDLNDYESQTINAAKFLDGFIWPIKQRYISAYNEPNDAKFWYKKVDPAEYARILDFTIDTFKDQNPNFYMLNGALNVSATSSVTYMDAFDFMYSMNKEVPGIFNKLDGWASHPYPQPNFSGSPYAKGRNSIVAYSEELNYLYNNLRVTKELPVFITETGWAHAEGESYNGSYLSVDKISEYFRVAFEEIWLPDDRVVAVTPFTIIYEAPFDHFSWVNKDKVPYKHYEVIKSLPKVKGEPNSLQVGVIQDPACIEND